MPPPDAIAALSTFLADRDAPCPCCGYSLRGLTSDRCPECNESLALRVGLAEPRLAMFIAGLLGPAAWSGFFLVVLLWGVIAREARSPHIVALAFGLMLASGFTALWIRRWRKTRNASLPTRLALASLGWLVPSTGAVWFFSIL
jgi:hypothetical protein